jgi:hypothetical protein
MKVSVSRGRGSLHKSLATTRSVEISPAFVGEASTENVEVSVAPTECNSQNGTSSGEGTVFENVTLN